VIDKIIEQIIKRVNALDSRVSHLERLEQAMADNRGWVGGSWQRDPLRLGYSERIARQWSNESLPSGNSDVNDSVVPSGEIWIITSIAFEYGGTPPPTAVTVRLSDGVKVYSYWAQAAPASAISYGREGYWVLRPGDKLSLRVVGAAAGHYLRGWATGFRVDIDQ
jgi:hypothetical protein